MTTTEPPTWDDDGDADLALMIVHAFAVSLKAAHERTPDLLDGFVAGRYQLGILSDEMLVVPVQPSDPSVLLDADS